MNNIKKTLSIVAVAGLATGIFAGLFFSGKTVLANNGLYTSAVPSTGTLFVGDTLTVHFTDPSNTTDATSTNCQVNGVEVSETFQNLSPGDYIVTYTVASTSASRTAETVPINCTLSESSSVTVTAFDDGNTLSIDTNGDGVIDNGTNNLGFTIVATPNSGTLGIDSALQVDMQDPLPSADVVIGSAGCRVNDVDVSGTYAYQGNGLYRVIYTVGEGNADRAAGEIPFDCTLQNNTGSVHLVSFTDSNTVAIDTPATSTATSTMSVTSVDQVESVALAGGGFNDGWVWVLNLTVPSNETSLQVKFNDWSGSSGTIPVASNMRISSTEAASSTPVTITAANTYSSPMTLSGDRDPGTSGRQIQIRVEMQVPEGTANGSYSTSYGIRSFE